MSWSALRSAFDPLALAAPLVGLALGEVRRPAHVVDVDLLAVRVEVEDLGDGLLEQRRVVADHDETAPVGPEELAQPDDRVGVEVVGRLVEEQRLGAGEQDAGQLDAAPLTTRQGAQRLGHQPVLDPERGRDLGGLGLGGVPTAGVQVGVRALVAAHRPVADEGSSLPISSSAAWSRRTTESRPRADRIARGPAPRGRRSAGPGQVADRAGGVDLAGGGQAVAGEDAGQRGLPAPLRPTRPTVSGSDPEGDVVHQQPSPGSDLELLGTDHEAG